MKASWAHNNGKRMMREAKENLDNSIPDHGWIERDGVHMYAEKKYGTLWVKTYANRTQANRKAEKIGGCHVSFDHPFKIIKTV